MWRNKWGWLFFISFLILLPFIPLWPQVRFPGQAKSIYRISTLLLWFMITNPHWQACWLSNLINSRSLFLRWRPLPYTETVYRLMPYFIVFWQTISFRIESARENLNIARSIAQFNYIFTCVGYSPQFRLRHIHYTIDR